MKILKKNQLAIMVVSLMLITAGYLSYGSNLNVETTSRIEQNQSIGDNGEIPNAELADTDIQEENMVNTENNENLEQNVVKQEKAVSAPIKS